MLAHGQIVMQILLVNSTTGAQESTGRGPQAFAGVGVALAAPLAILIARPFFLAGPDGVVHALDLVVTLPLSCITRGAFLRGAVDVGLQRLASGMLTHAPATLPPVTPYRPDHRRPGVVVRPVPTLLVGAASGRLQRLGVVLPFFPPRSDTSPPSLSRDPARPSHSPSHRPWLGGAGANERRTGARAPVRQLRGLPVRLGRLHALPTQPSGAPRYSRQRGLP
jgi:hypothetical protein